jgi:hypothetical protein
MDTLSTARQSVDEYLKGWLERQRVAVLRKEAEEAREKLEEANKVYREKEEALRSSPRKTPPVGCSLMTVHRVVESPTSGFASEAPASRI